MLNKESPALEYMIHIPLASIIKSEAEIPRSIFISSRFGQTSMTKQAESLLTQHNHLP